MSNVVKLKKKKPGIEAWKEQIEEHGDKLMDRIYDAIRLADEEAKDEDIPEEFVDCTILGVLTGVIVQITENRNIIGPEELLSLLKYQIYERPHEEDDAS